MKLSRTNNWVSLPNKLEREEGERMEDKERGGETEGHQEGVNRLRERKYPSTTCSV